MFFWLSIITGGLAVFFLVFSMTGIALAPTQARARRIEEVIGISKEDTLFVELETPFWERLTAPLINRISSLARSVLPQEKEQKYRKRLELAGNPAALNVQTFIVIKYGLAIVLGLVGLLISPLLALCGFAVGMIAPEFWLNSQRKARKEQVISTLPDMLDLLCISVSAGLGFDAALARVGEKFSGPLANEFNRALQEIRMGKPRREALREMADRLEVDEVGTLVGAIIQADTLGVSITRVLEIQSAQQRVSRRQKAEEIAQKAPIKMLIPLVIFIFPTIFVVLLGPAVIRILDTLM